MPKLFEGNHAYFLQHNDQRVIFVIPYHGFSMIGTTDIHYTGDLNHIEIGEEEIDYLIELVNAYFKFKITKGDIVHSWSGIRPLLADDSKETKSLSRDYSYEFYNSPAPIITIFGGKITTYRQLAEEVINQLTSIFPRMKPSKTKHTPLPGATLADMSFAQYVNYARTKYHWLDDALLNRYLNTYGCYTEIFLSQCSNMEAMGKKYGLHSIRWK